MSERPHTHAHSALLAPALRVCAIAFLSLALATTEAARAATEILREDFDADPAETADVLTAHPDIAAGLEARLTAVVQTGRTSFGGRRSNDGEAWWSDLTWIPQP